MITATGAPDSLPDAPINDSKSTETSATPLQLDQIQGNIIGFNKDHQTFLFLRFPQGGETAVRRWLRDLVPQVSTAAEVLAFNNAFKKLRDLQPGLETSITATWLNVAFTYA